ncbi:PREDICTED: Ileal sodium/bile acid cotransporter [Prunus dulcis]|uniref:PREDICTED: Ileal sodium/bile acid cotransporter n=1 Tax=Prunus dulcis TaxID=3755 RepID=A0A5E4F8I1_PRUDU|nr:PREDICTED: Ileal sodium/bile acid cotransporter [Prunus dulcis]
MKRSSENLTSLYVYFCVMQFNLHLKPSNDPPIPFPTAIKLAFHHACMALSRLIPAVSLNLCSIIRVRCLTVSQRRSRAVDDLPVYISAIDMEMQTSPAPQAPLSFGKTILNLSFQAALTLATQNSSSLGQAQEQPPLLPLKIANVSFVIAFAASFTGIFLQHASPRAAKIVEIIGSFLTAMGFFLQNLHNGDFVEACGLCSEFIGTSDISVMSDLLHSRSQARMKEEGHVTQIPLELNYRSEFGSSSLQNMAAPAAAKRPRETHLHCPSTHSIFPKGTRVYAFAFPINTFNSSRRTPNSRTVIPTGTLEHWSYWFCMAETDSSVTRHVHKWLTQRAKLEVHGNELQSSLLLHLVTILANSAPDENKGAPAKITRVSF